MRTYTVRGITVTDFSRPDRGLGSVLDALIPEVAGKKELLRKAQEAQEAKQ